jgi:hypothetical protein
LGVRDGPWNGDWYNCGACISIRGDSHAGYRGALLAPAELIIAGIASRPVRKRDREVALLVRDHGPIDKARELVDRLLNPGLKKRVDGRSIRICDGTDPCGSKIGLAEHVAVVAQAKEVTHGVSLLICHQVGKVARASGRVGPFLESAGWCITIVVNAGRPARDDLKSCVAIACIGGDVCVHLIHGTQKNWSGVVSDGIGQASIDPSGNGISVVKAGYGRWYKTICREGSTGDTNLLQPGLVEGDFFVSIRICSVVKVIVSESMADMRESISVACCFPPNFERIKTITCSCKGLLGWRTWPLVNSRSQRFDEFEGGFTVVTLVDSPCAAC